VGDETADRTAAAADEDGDPLPAVDTWPSDEGQNHSS
jgi:hypothetical protein